MIPVPVSFAGMPNTRWWTFEDRKTNFGDVGASTTDLAKLMFLEFALVYANDWFVVPWTLPAGVIATVRGLAVTTVFGERLWIESADAGLEPAARRWRMFTVDVTGADGATSDPGLVLLPAAVKIDQGPPTEDVMLVRDESANMVWGIETHACRWRPARPAAASSRPGCCTPTCRPWSEPRRHRRPRPRRSATG